MNVAICVKSDLLGNFALNRLLPMLRTSGHKISILLSDLVTKKERETRQGRELLFYERDLPLEHLFPILNNSSITNPVFMTFERLASLYDARLYPTGNVNTPENISLLRAIKPQVILSLRYDWIFKQEILDIPGVAILNIHPGELPRYRGVYAPFRAMLNGDKLLGATLHMIDSGIDTGPVIAVERMPVNPQKSVFWHTINLYPLVFPALVRTLECIRDGRQVITRPQDESQAGYYSFPNEDEFTAFASRGFELVNHRDYLEIISYYHKQDHSR